MKKILAIFVALVVSGSVFASGVDHVSGTEAIVINSGSTVKLFYKSDKESKVRVSIFNEKHALVFRESFNQVNGFARPYNFTDLGSGKYTIEVNDGGVLFQEEITIALPDEPKGSKVAKLAKVVNSKDKYVLSIPNKGLNTVTISIYNAKNELQFSATENLNGDFAKVYNLKDFKGDVSFKVTDAEGKNVKVID